MKQRNLWSLIFCAIAISFSLSASALGSCSAPVNAIEAENCLPGAPSSQWDLNSDLPGDPTIQGFATDISVNVGQIINFKIDTNASNYTIDIYRMGYYQGNGARRIASIRPSAKLPQTQPACMTDVSTMLVDCGNWAISASWAVPTNAVSGIYFAHIIRTDTGGDNHIVFVVRNDASHSAMLFQTSDETWQAYNGYGAGSLYGPENQFNLSARAYKVSYNRPVITRFGTEAVTFVFGSEYPMVRFLEANGYDVNYFTGIDAARSGSLILNHKLYLSVGHDEYWSGPHRASVEAAKNAGVNLGFFSGNEVFWKTRLEPSIDGTNTPDRTLVCYKETLNNGPLDPMDPSTWTGTWRDGRFSPPADGGRPENALTGTAFMVNGPGTDNPGSLSLQVPYADGRMRFWRNTSVGSQTSGQTVTLPKGTLGYEWDEDLDNGSRPAGLVRMSTATYPITVDLLLNQGAIYGGGNATHHLTLYKAPSGALVFGAGTIQWPWGLDSNHDNPFFGPNLAPNASMQQATVNLFADMGIQPATLISGLVRATATTDNIAPTSTITSPGNGSSVQTGTVTTITGTAADVGGVVGGVEISTDSGSTWHPANGRENWSYTWQPGDLGNIAIESRATDDSGNIGSPSSSAVTVTPPDCPCSDWSPTAAPAQVDSGDTNSVELGVRFRADFDGYITGIRFYKASTNTGTHVGNLWTSAGSLLATATFSNETASGWQQVNFGSPVAVTANKTYVASYFAPAGHYSYSILYFQNGPSNAPPLHLLQDGTDGSNGLYSYTSTSAFPRSSFQSDNYWVDVVYVPAASMPGAPPALLTSPSKLTFAGFAGQPNPPSQGLQIYNEGSGTLNWTATSNSSWLVATPSGTTPASLSVSVNTAGLATGTYTGTITVNAAGTTNGPQTISVSLLVTNLWLFSNFADGTMNGWAFSPLGFASNWSVASGALQYNGGGHTQVYAGDAGWTDYNLNVSVKLATMSDYPGGIRGRLNFSTGAGYAVWLYPSEGVVKLFRNSAWNIDNGLVQLGQGNVKFDTTNYHNVQLSFNGSAIQVAFDGNTVISATDATYSSGAIALDVSNRVISFTNVMVTSLSANPGSLTPAPASLALSTNYGSSPPPQNVQLTATGGPVVWTASTNASWLNISPGVGLTSATPQVSVSSAALNPGTYNGVVTFVALGAGPAAQSVNVQLTVNTLPPSLVVAPGALRFFAIGNQPVSSQTLGVSNGGGLGTFNWTLSTSANTPWLSASPGGGSVPQAISVSVNPTGLAVGSYSGNLTVTAAGVANSPRSVPVSLQVLSSDLKETFQDLGSGWVISPLGLGNGWTVSNGVYSYAGLGLSQSCAGNTAWTDYSFDANIQLSNLSNWPGGIRGRVNPITGAGYAVWLYPGSNQLVLYSVSQWNINAGAAQLASAPVTLDTRMHDLKLGFQGNVISVYWDGTFMVSATDNSYPSGYICMDADNQPISYSNVQVAAVQNAVTIDSVNPSSLVFNSVGGSVPAARTLNISAGGATTTWAASSNAAWLTVSASNSLTPGQLAVSTNPAGLTQGSYSGTITISVPGASNSPLTIPVTLTLSSSALSLSPASLTFFGAVGLNPAAQNIAVSNLGTGSMNWTATKTQNWLTLGSTSGSAPSSIGITVSSSTTGTGTFSDTVTVTAPGASNSPASVPVTTQVGSLQFTDNFSSGAGNWSFSPLGSPAGWSIINGAYTYNGSGESQVYAGSSAWTDYTVAGDFQLASTNDYPGGLRGRVNTTTGASYGLWLYPAERVLKLFRIGQWNIDADFSLLGQSAQLAIDTNVHNLRLVFQGTTIKAYFDNALAISATDASYSQGAIALDPSNQPISFDNITVISLP
jgi:hypothetical protein